MIFYVHIYCRLKSWLQTTTRGDTTSTREHRVASPGPSTLCWIKDNCVLQIVLKLKHETLEVLLNHNFKTFLRDQYRYLAPGLHRFSKTRKSSPRCKRLQWHPAHVAWWDQSHAPELVLDSWLVDQQICSNRLSSWTLVWCRSCTNWYYFLTQLLDVHEKNPQELTGWPPPGGVGCRVSTGLLPGGLFYCHGLKRNHGHLEDYI